MTKLIGIAGSIGEESYNRELLQFISKHYQDQVDIELLNINDIPVFSPDRDLTETSAIQNAYLKIRGADGVILATPEHNHSVPAALKNLIEWLSFNLHPFENKPVWIVGASYHQQGSSRAQLHLKQILESPGVNAIVMPGDEFLLSNAREAFDDDGNLKSERTVGFLDMLVKKFLKFVRALDLFDAPEFASYQDEDLTASNPVNTTIEGVDMNSDNWVEEAAAKVHAVDGSTYVKLDRGILTVNQLNYFLNTMPVELTYADDNNQFIYYNHDKPASKMLAPRQPGQTGDPMASVHPARAVDHVKQVIHTLRTGESDLVAMPVPGNGPDKHIMHYYKAMHDENGRYRGINEWVVDIMPVIKYYLGVTGQKLVDDPEAKKMAPIIGLDVTSGASEKPKASGATASAKLDTTSGASEADDASATPNDNSVVDTDDAGIDVSDLLNSGNNIATEGIQPVGTKPIETPKAPEPTSAPQTDTVSGASEG